MKQILVTGGAGFLGSWLCRRLLESGDKVICLDNFFTGHKKNVQNLLDNPNFKLVEHDIVSPFEADVDEIYNLACPASPIHYQYDPIKTIKTSFNGAENMLELAKKHNAKIFQASTSEVYGDPQVHPQTEEYWGHVNPIGIRSCYDEGKRISETLFVNYNEKHNVKVKIGRIFNTYGPHMHPQDGRVVSNFIIQALQNNDITIYGDGSQTRSFCFADDLISAFVKLMNDTPDDFIGPVNIGNPDEFTIKQLAEMVLRLTGSTSKVTYLPLPQDDPLQRQPNITLAKEVLKWQPEIKLEDGLIKTIEYFKSLIKNDDERLA